MNSFAHVSVDAIRAQMPVVESLSAWAPQESTMRDVGGDTERFSVSGMKMVRESFSDGAHKLFIGSLLAGTLLPLKDFLLYLQNCANEHRESDKLSLSFRTGPRLM